MLGKAGEMGERSCTVEGAVQNDMPNYLNGPTTRAGMRIIGVRAMPSRVFTSENIDG
jgi:hypothetical protein